MDQLLKLKKKAIRKVAKENDKYKTLKELSFLLGVFTHQPLIYTSYPNFFMPNGTLTQSFTVPNNNFLVWSSSVQQVPAVFSFQFPLSAAVTYDVVFGFGNTPGLVAFSGSPTLWTDIVIELAYLSSGGSVININQSGTGVQLYAGTASSINSGGIITIDALTNPMQYRIQFNGTSTPSLANYLSFPKNPVTQSLYFTFGVYWAAGGSYNASFNMVQTINNLFPQ